MKIDMNFSRWLEVFNTSNFQWVQQDSDLWEATFSIRQWVFKSEFKYSRRENYWTYQFLDPWGRVGITGFGNASHILGNAISVVKDFIKQKQPREVRFSAREDNRAGLYNKLMLKNLRGITGYGFTTTPKSDPIYGSTYFSLTKGGKPDDDILGSSKRPSATPPVPAPQQMITQKRSATADDDVLGSSERPSAVPQRPAPQQVIAKKRPSKADDDLFN